MGLPYIAYMKITDKNGKEFIYALHENKETKEESGNLTEDELQILLKESLVWN